jgi:uncharacterized protein
MWIARLWRYPVKSMQGEEMTCLQVSGVGVAGDRRFGVLDVATGTVVSAKRDGRLLEARAMYAGVELAIALPTGETVLGLGAGVDAALSDWLGRPVRLIEATPHGRATFESQADFEDDSSGAERWTGPEGSFVDSSPIHVITTATLRSLALERPDLQWELPRFRPNMLIDEAQAGLPELGWAGRGIRIGDVELVVRKPCSRCVMTTRPQPGGIERQLDVLRHLGAVHGSDLGALCGVVTAGSIEIGQEAELHP